jgi:hypothetical protein
MQKIDLIPVSNDHDQVVTQPVDKDPVVPADLIKDHPPKLSKNMKLSMRHLDFVENAIPVSEEWTFVDGVAVAPQGRDEKISYTKTEDKKYSDYGKVEYTTVEVYKDDPAQEVVETIKVTDGTLTENDDPEYVDAIAPLAVDRKQSKSILLEGRHGEVSYDPISNENYLTRPGMEVKTSETYLDILEKEESDEELPEPDPTSLEEPDETPKASPEKSVAEKASSAKVVDITVEEEQKPVSQKVVDTVSDETQKTTEKTTNRTRRTTRDA